MLIFCILDGWGYSEQYEHNAIAQANLPFINSLMKKGTFSLLNASGPAVGLSSGQMGNSEVGHITIGAGRVVLQDLELINQSIEDNTLYLNTEIQNLMQYCQNNQKPCHLFGLISDGGVHSHINHLISCVNILKKNNIPYYVHAITDGRDTPPNSAATYLNMLKKEEIQIASISGRFYAMDRDNRTERTQKYYNAAVKGDAPVFKDLGSESDEFIEPHIADWYHGLQDGDAVFMTNFRADRARQILLKIMRNHQVYGVGMTSYSSELDAYMRTLFPKQNLSHTLGEVIANAGYHQLRIAETEKYAHVTYFLNGGREEPFANEDRIMVPSPKIATYDLQPAMSAIEITDQLITAIRSEKYQFICVNFANADMVGHTANMKATISACETIDQCLQRVAAELQKYNGEMLITADHGNAEQLFDSNSNQSHTAHTINSVPLLYFGPQNVNLQNGELQDVAPTILRMLNIAQPQHMVGKALIS